MTKHSVQWTQFVLTSLYPRRAATWSLSVFTWLVIFLPLTVYLAKVPEFGELQGNDYYGILHRIVEGEEISYQPARWLNLKANEHRVSLPVLVYVANMALADGHNLGLTAFSLLLLAVTLVIMVRLLPTDLRANGWLRTGFGFTLALFCFTPVAAHSVAMGFSGSIWFFANALSVAAIAVLSWRAERGSYWTLWPVLLLGTLGAFTHSTHLMLWPAVLVGALFLRLRFRRLILLAAGATWILALFVFTYQSLASHPAPTTRGISTLLSYTAVYLGGLFSADVNLARVVGSVAMLGSVISLALMVCLPWVWKTLPSKDLRTDLAPWLMIQLYGLGNAAMAAIGRAGFGMEQALASRYASMAALFWVGLLIPFGIIGWRLRPNSRLGRVGVAVGLISLAVGAAVAMHVRGASVMDRFLARGSRQPVAALALHLGIADDYIFSRAVTPAPRQMYRVYNFMKASGHVPFHRPYRWRLGERIEASLLSDQPHPQLQGEFERLTQGLHGGFVRPSGWAYSRSSAVAEVIVLDKGGVYRGEIFTGIHRPELRQRVGDEALVAGWEGYARVDSKSGQLRSWVRLAGDPLFYPLPTRESVTEQLLIGPEGGN